MTDRRRTRPAAAEPDRDDEDGRDPRRPDPRPTPSAAPGRAAVIATVAVCGVGFLVLLTQLDFVRAYVRHSGPLQVELVGSPSPGPAPTPNPGPGPEPAPAGPFAGVADEAYRDALAVRTRDLAGEARAIADAMDRTADRADRGEFDRDEFPLESALKEAGRANAAALGPAAPAWRPWSDAVVRSLLDLYDRADGPLQTARDAAAALRAIAARMRDVR